MGLSEPFQSGDSSSQAGFFWTCFLLHSKGLRIDIFLCLHNHFIAFIWSVPTWVWARIRRGLHFCPSVSLSCNTLSSAAGGAVASTQKARDGIDFLLVF